MANPEDGVRPAVPPFRVGDWWVEPDLDAIKRGETLRHVEPKVMAALIALARRAGEVLTKAELTDAVWQVPCISENRLVGSSPNSGEPSWRRRGRASIVETIPPAATGLAVPVEERRRGDHAGSGIALVLSRPTQLPAPAGEHHRARCRRLRQLGVGLRTHARIEAGDGGARDLGSKNGTYHNGAKLSGPAQLHDGDEVRLGRGAVVLRFVSALGATRTETGRAMTPP
jgi:hypothetical protein